MGYCVGVVSLRSPWAGLGLREQGEGRGPAPLPILLVPYVTPQDPGRVTGLGLAMSRTIVESMCCRIFAECTEGKGSTSLICQSHSSTC